MTVQAADTSVRASIVVEAPIERAFSVFTEDFGRWWDPEHHILEADLAEMVFDGRPGECQAMTAAQHARRLGRCRRRVLDGLRLVQNHVVELVFGQTRRITPKRSVRGDHEIVVGDGG